MVILRFKQFSRSIDFRAAFRCETDRSCLTKISFKICKNNLHDFLQRACQTPSISLVWPNVFRKLSSSPQTIVGFERNKKRLPLERSLSSNTTTRNKVGGRAPGQQGNVLREWTNEFNAIISAKTCFPPFSFSCARPERPTHDLIYSLSLSIVGAIMVVYWKTKKI